MIAAVSGVSFGSVSAAAQSGGRRACRRRRGLGGGSWSPGAPEGSGGLHPAGPAQHDRDRAMPPPMSVRRRRALVIGTPCCRLGPARAAADTVGWGRRAHDTPARCRPRHRVARLRAHVISNRLFDICRCRQARGVPAAPGPPIIGAGKPTIDRTPVPGGDRDRSRTVSRPHRVPAPPRRAAGRADRLLGHRADARHVHPDGRAERPRGVRARLPAWTRTASCGSSAPVAARLRRPVTPRTAS